MPDYNVLYYPDFTPKALWLRRVLLLADSVTRIVPPDVKPNDSEDVLAVQEAVPGSLTSVAPEPRDTAIERGDEERYRRVFGAVAQQRRPDADEIRITVSGGGHLAIANHEFVHDAKLSDFVLNQLRVNNLMIDGLGDLAGDHFVVVQRDASDVILAGLAAKIAARLGIDAITDKPLPFAATALSDIDIDAAAGSAEGALLTALARTSIPAAVAHLRPDEYAELRSSYAPIREAFKSLTRELAQVHRLDRMNDPSELAKRVEATANDFHQRFIAYRDGRDARAFKKWTPLFIATALAIPGPLASTPELRALIGASAAFAVHAIRQQLTLKAERHAHIFNMLTGLRSDLVEQSQISRLI
jgi:hypothetical protein